MRLTKECNDLPTVALLAWAMEPHQQHLWPTRHHGRGLLLDKRDTILQEASIPYMAMPPYRGIFFFDSGRVFSNSFRGLVLDAIVPPAFCRGPSFLGAPTGLYRLESHSSLLLRLLLLLLASFSSDDYYSSALSQGHPRFDSASVVEARLSAAPVLCVRKKQR